MKTRVSLKYFVNDCRLNLKNCLLSPDQPNSGGADSKYFIGSLKAIFFFELKICT